MKNATSILLVVALSISGCSNPSTKNPEGSMPTLVEQKGCSDQASKFFQEDETKRKEAGISSARYTSHYDPQTKICAIEIFTGYMDDHHLYRKLYLIVDAFEGRELGSFRSVLEVANDCRIQPRNLAEIFCHSEQEFNSLSLKYFGVSAD